MINARTGLAIERFMKHLSRIFLLGAAMWLPRAAEAQQMDTLFNYGKIVGIGPVVHKGKKREQQVGEWRYFDVDGSMRRVIVYHRKLLHGWKQQEIAYHTAGVISQQAMYIYRNDSTRMMHGWMTTFYGDGQRILEKAYNWKDRQLIAREYNEDRHIVRTLRYVNDSLYLRKQYNGAGRLVQKGNLKFVRSNNRYWSEFERPVGAWEEFSEDGRLRFTGTMVAIYHPEKMPTAAEFAVGQREILPPYCTMEKDGKWTVFFEDKPIRAEIYEKGVVVGEEEVE